MVVGQRNLDEEHFSLHIFPATYRETAGGTSTVLGWDSHNSVTLGIDRDGFYELDYWYIKYGNGNILLNDAFDSCGTVLKPEPRPAPSGTLARAKPVEPVQAEILIGYIN
jgi:hypothetical protein